MNQQDLSPNTFEILLVIAVWSSLVTALKIAVLTDIPTDILLLTIIPSLKVVFVVGYYIGVACFVFSVIELIKARNKINLFVMCASLLVFFSAYLQADSTFGYCQF